VKGKDSSQDLPLALGGKNAQNTWGLSLPQTKYTQNGTEANLFSHPNRGGGLQVYGGGGKKGRKRSKELSNAKNLRARGMGNKGRKMDGLVTI